MISVEGDPLKHNIRAWIVAVDVKVAHGVPGRQGGVVFHTLSIIVNGTTGGYEFGYLWTPESVSTPT